MDEITDKFEHDFETRDEVIFFLTEDATVGDLQHILISLSNIDPISEALVVWLLGERTPNMFKDKKSRLVSIVKSLYAVPGCSWPHREKIVDICCW